MTLSVSFRLQSFLPNITHSQEEDIKEAMGLITEHLCVELSVLEKEFTQIQPFLKVLHKSKSQSSINSLSSLLTVIIDHSSIPNIRTIIVALLAVPQTTADCEWGFSLLKLLKTDLRNHIGSVNLNHAMMVAVEGPEVQSISDFDFAKAKELFKAKKSVKW